MSRIASLFYDALAYLVFFEIRMRLDKRDVVELLYDEYRDVRMLIIGQVSDPPGACVAEATRKD
jgi:hypothetical protein